MKFLVYLFSLGLILSGLTSCAEREPEALDGKTFNIQTWDKSLPDEKTPDQFIFSKGMIDSPECHKWGFYATDYTCKTNNGVVNFEFTMTSEVEGVLEFTGFVKENHIEGTYFWKKEGQVDIAYGFEGALAE